VSVALDQVNAINRLALFGSLLAGILTACSPDLEPDRYPPGTRVALKMGGSTYELGLRSSELFLDMLTNQPIHTEISKMPAAPMGTFTVCGVDYRWHGNGVTRGRGRKERLWYGPYLQRLIATVMQEDHSSPGSVQRILDALEMDPTVANTPLEGPGAYPGGGDALHPARLDDPEGWRVFTPETNQPSRRQTEGPTNRGSEPGPR